MREARVPAVGARLRKCDADVLEHDPDAAKHENRGDGDAPRTSGRGLCA
jgi:hypothetical protein